MNIEPARTRNWWNTPAALVLSVFIAAAAVYLWLDHKVHILEALPLLLPFAICVGLHVFVHRGHRGDRHGH